MNRKSPSTSKTKINVSVASDAKDEKSADSIVPNRPILGKDATASAPVQEDGSPVPAEEPIIAQPKRTVINPVSDLSDIKPPAKPAPNKATKVDVKASDVGQPEAQTEETAESPDTSTTPTESNQDTSTNDAGSPDSTATSDTAEQPQGQPTKETLKAVADATEAAKRDQKVQEYIDNHQFFVPINSVAQKRSIKISSLMTVFILLLAIVLIDLLLDTGAIFFVQKIPHTHFFTVETNQP